MRTVATLSVMGVGVLLLACTAERPQLTDPHVGLQKVAANIPTTTRLYWGENGGHRIVRADQDGSNVEVLVTGVVAPDLNRVFGTHGETPPYCCGWERSEHAAQ